MDCDNPQCHLLAHSIAKDVFADLGVDIDKPEALEEFREDLRFGRKMRKAAEHSLIALLGAIITAAVAVVVMHLKDQ